jgi:orotate phosphoribosyltransferase
LENPRIARQIGKSLAERLRAFSPESVLAPALGGLIIGYEVASSLEVPFRFTERAGEGMALRRGFRLDRGERVVLLEDVVTTGRSSLEAMSVATEQGARIVGAGAILDRTGGVNPFEVPFESLLALRLETYPAESCPLCAEGQPAVQPGSRPAKAGV